MSEFWRFLCAVKEQWGRLVTGSLAIGILGLLQQARPVFRVPSYVYWLIICGTLFWAFFGAWRREHRKAVIADALLKGMRERRSEIIGDWTRLNELHGSNDLPDPMAPTWGHGEWTRPYNVGILQAKTNYLRDDSIRTGRRIEQLANVRSVPELLVILERF